MGGRGRGGDGKETQRRMISNKTAIEGSCEGEKIREGRGRIQREQLRKKKKEDGVGVDRGWWKQKYSTE